MTTSISDKKQILFVDDDECSEELVTLTLTNHEIIAACCSAASYERYIGKALRCGAQAYLIKPISQDDLQQAVERLTSPVNGRKSAARLAELAAILEELDIRYEQETARFESAKEKLLRAEEKLMRLKAEKASL